MSRIRGFGYNDDAHHYVDKSEAKARISAQIKAFIAAGNEIEEIELGVVSRNAIPFRAFNSKFKDGGRS